MAVHNPTFELPGVDAGTAAHWTVHTAVQHQRIAGFGPSEPEPIETFARDTPRVLLFDAGLGAWAVFETGRTVEDFASHAPFLMDGPEGREHAALWGEAAVEDFAAGWGLKTLALNWNAIPSETATWGSGGAVETFLHKGFLDRWAALPADALERARWNGGLTPVENFAWAPTWTGGG